MATLDSTPEDNVMRLNKFVAQSGICTRRKAVDLVKSGAISINGQVETNAFYELKVDDKVTHQGHLLEKKEDFVEITLKLVSNDINEIMQTFSIHPADFKKLRESVNRSSNAAQSSFTAPA